MVEILPDSVQLKACLALCMPGRLPPRYKDNFMKRDILILLLLPVSFLLIFSSEVNSAEKFRLWSIAWKSNKDIISPKTINNGIKKLHYIILQS